MQTRSMDKKLQQKKQVDSIASLIQKLEFLKLQVISLKDENTTLKKKNSALTTTLKKMKKVRFKIDEKKLTNNQKYELFLSYNGPSLEGLCYCCKKPLLYHPTTCHAAHIIPRSKGGETTFENMRITCADCNLKCGTSNLLDYMRRVGFKIETQEEHLNRAIRHRRMKHHRERRNSKLSDDETESESVNEGLCGYLSDDGFVVM